MRNSVRSTCKPSESDIEPPKYTALLTAATAPFGREPKCSASSVARVTTSSRGTTSSTAPLARASAGVNGLPSRMATKDRWVPIRRVSRWVPPPPGLGVLVLTKLWIARRCLLETVSAEGMDGWLGRLTSDGPTAWDGTYRL